MSTEATGVNASREPNFLLARHEQRVLRWIAPACRGASCPTT